MKVRVSQDSQATVVVLAGDIDERVTEGLAQVSSNVKTSDVTFDCDGVQNINSLGIRQWMFFMASFGAQRKMTFRNCPPSLIDYATMLPKTFGAGKVESLYLTYYCELCQASSKALIDFAKLKDNREVANSRCSKCANELQTDMDLESVCMLSAV